jgi:FkbM family methyltransferase
MKNESSHIPHVSLQGISPSSRPAAILGNGPSLCGFDFARNLSEFDTFGMNVAYRYWDRINWYPTYYSCLDIVVGLSHKDSIHRLIVNAEKYGIRKFLLRANLIDSLGGIGTLPCVQCLEQLQTDGNLFFCSTRITTGSHTLAWAASLGYRDIVLLGIDGYTVEILPEAERQEGFILEIKNTPEANPNYFFDDYQQAGDRYNIPNPTLATGAIHQISWHSVRPQLEFSGTLVVNANPESSVNAFPRLSFKEALPALAAKRDELERMRQDPGFAGIYCREDDAHFDELRVFYPFFPEKNGSMIDVGAHHGGSCLRFLRRGWRVHAFEPDISAREMLRKNAYGLAGLTLDERAVSKVSGREYPWYTTSESTGASSMMPFTPAHALSGAVSTITLRDYCDEQGITDLNFLKIDAEGFDYMVLQGFPFDRLRPRWILCEFEDRKTVLVGNSMHDMGKLLLDMGYSVFMSEWHPVLRYGLRHQWRRFLRYPSEPVTPLAWGNLLAFAEEPDALLLRKSVRAAIQSGTASPPTGNSGRPE